MSGPFTQNNVGIIASVAALRSTQGSGLPPVVYVQGTSTPNDGGQAFYALGAFGQVDNGTTIIVTSDKYCFNQSTDVSLAQIVAALTNNGTTPGLDPLSKQGANIASATTTDLSKATGNFINVTGTTTITGLGTLAAGDFRFVTFTGILTLTYNATSLILPGQVNITTAAGDTALFMSLGAGNWQCLYYTVLAGGSEGVTPISEGGTGKTTSGAAFDALFAAGANVVAATTTPIGAATGPTLSVTGNTTITAFDTVAAGTSRWVKFTGTPLLTYNATSLILPGSANIQAAANDFALFQSLGAGNWICLYYSPANGLPFVVTPITKGGTGQITSVAGFDALEAKGADIASATTTDLSTATGPFVNITGSTTITAFGTVAAGTQRELRFTGAPLLTYNATSLILPSSANIQAAAGDTALMESLGSGNWRCLNYQRFSALPLIAVTTALGGTGKTSAASSLTPTRQFFTASGLYTAPAGLTSAIVYTRGAGGGGGGVSSAVARLGAGGGGQGSFSIGLLTTAQIGASQTVTLNNGGTAGANTGGAGGAGGSTTFGSLVTSNGGGGGSGVSAVGASAGGAGGTAGTGDIAIPGCPGLNGFGVTAIDDYGGAGGGEGGGVNTNGNAAGNNGSMGGGGSGAASAGSTAAIGGVGGKGWVLVVEFYT